MLYIVTYRIVYNT